MFKINVICTCVFDFEMQQSCEMIINMLQVVFVNAIMIALGLSVEARTIRGGLADFICPLLNFLLLTELLNDSID